jgi:hypothetical protein
MTGRIALGLVAVLRAALIYGDGADLSERPIGWPRRKQARQLPELARIRVGQERVG